MNKKATENDRFPRITDPLDFLTRIEERDDVDYKLKIGSEKAARISLTKDIAAMANIGGGILIFGVAPDSELHGIEAHGLRKYDSAAIHDLCRSLLSPVPEIRMHVVVHNGLHFPFVTIGGIGSSPVLVAKGIQDESGKKFLIAEGDLYIRENTQTRKASTEAQVRKVIDAAISTGLRDRLGLLAPIFAAAPTIAPTPIAQSDGRNRAYAKLGIDGNTAVREFLLVPESSVKSDIGLLKTAFGVNVELSGIGYPHQEFGTRDDVVGRLADGFFSSWLPERLWKQGSRCSVGGDFFWIGTLVEDFMAREDRKLSDAISVSMELSYIVAAVQQSVLYSRVVAPSVEWKLTHRLRNVAGRKMVTENSLPFFTPKVTLESEIVSSTVIPIKPEKGAIQKAAADLALSVFELFNWDMRTNASGVVSQIDQLVSKSRVSDKSLFLGGTSL